MRHLHRKGIVDQEFFDRNLEAMEEHAGMEVGVTGAVEASRTMVAEEERRRRH